MVNLIATDATNNNALTGAMLARSPNENSRLSFVERLHAEPRNEQGFSWVAQVGRTPSRLSQMQLDSKGFSWVTHLEAQAQRNLQPVENAIRMVMDEKHREKVGAEAPQRDTPALKPLFGKNPVKGKFSLKNLREKNEPKSFFGMLLN